MASTIIDQLTIASWAGNNNTNFVDGNACKPTEATLSIQADEVDDTALAAAIKSRTSIPGLYQWTVAFTTRLQPSYVAGKAGVTFDTGYVLHARAWTMGLQWAVQDATEFDSNVTARTFIPGLLTAGGTYEVIQDTSTNLVVNLPGTSGPATFKVDTNTGGTAHSLAGSIYASQLSAPMRVGELAVATYTYRVSGDVTAAGDAGSGSGDRDYSPWGYWITNTLPIGLPATGTFTLNDTTGGTIVGEAFPSAVTVNVRVGELVTLNVTAQGTGALVLT